MQAHVVAIGHVAANHATVVPLGGETSQGGRLRDSSNGEIDFMCELSAMVLSLVMTWIQPSDASLSR